MIAARDDGGGPVDVAAASLVGTAIHVADVERSVAFYRDALGLADGGRWAHDDIVEVMLRPENGPESPVLILVGGKPATRRAEFSGRLMFASPNARDVCERIQASGGSVDQEPPADATGGSYVIAMGRDPDGIVLEIIQAAVPAN
jgi:catechol 2,3-dioxygenase-like lactoylglutathione lyase family enzyme